MDPQYPSEKPYVLVVDDHPEQLGALFSALQQAGYNLAIAQSGAEALELLKGICADVILLDVDLPDSDGFEICRRLKQDQILCGIPVLFTTASVDLTDKLEGFRAGGADYITKPFQLEEVLARVSTHLFLYRLHKELQAEKERFRGLSNASFEGIVFHDKGAIFEVNRTMEHLTGYSRDELLKSHVQDLLMPDCSWPVEESDVECVYEIQGRHNDGSAIPLEMQSRTVTYWDREIRVTALRDISRRKTLEEQTLKLESENVILKATLNDRDHLGELIGRSPAMQKVYERLLKAALSDAPIIIYGETGTGKELAARTIRQLSDTHAESFVSVNCAAVQESLFESQFFGYLKDAFTGASRDKPGYFDQAKRGILFLDEISELPLDLQAKLLRVLNNGEYTPVGATRAKLADVRIISATNRPLRAEVAAGRFREDLFYRLHVITIDMPPLRQHKEDLPLLATHFMRQINPDTDAGHHFPEEILTRFMDHDWPGNVRELVNEVRRYVTMDEVELRPADSSVSPEVPAAATTINAPGQSLSDLVDAYERKVIEDALTKAHGNRTITAEELKIPIATLYRKIQKYGL